MNSKLTYPQRPGWIASIAARRFINSLLLPTCVIVSGSCQAFAATPPGLAKAPRARQETPQTQRKVIVRPEISSRPVAAPSQKGSFQLPTAAQPSPSPVATPALVPVPAPEPVVQQTAATQQMSGVLQPVPAHVTPAPVAATPLVAAPTVPSLPTQPVSPALINNPPRGTDPSTMLVAPFIQKRGAVGRAGPTYAQPAYTAAPPRVRVPLPESAPLPELDMPTGGRPVSRPGSGKIEQAVGVKSEYSAYPREPQVLSELALTNVRPALGAEGLPILADSVSTAASRTVVRGETASTPAVVQPPPAATRIPKPVPAQVQTAPAPKPQQAQVTSTAIPTTKPAAPKAEPPRLVSEAEVSDEMFVDPVSRPTVSAAPRVTQVRSTTPAGSLAEIANLVLPEPELPLATHTGFTVPPVPAAEPVELPVALPVLLPTRSSLAEPGRFQLAAVSSPAAPTIESAKAVSQIAAETMEVEAESFTAQAGAATAVRQAPPVVTQLTATMGERKATPVQTAAVSASQQFALGEAAQAGSQVNESLAIGQKLYSRGQLIEAEAAFRAAMLDAATPYQRTLATYLVATCLRRQERWSEAVPLFEQVAAQKAEPTLASLARAQLNHADGHRAPAASMR